MKHSNLCMNNVITTDVNFVLDLMLFLLWKAEPQSMTYTDFYSEVKLVKPEVIGCSLVLTSQN